MDDQRDERREQLPEHETRPETSASGGKAEAAATGTATGDADRERLDALPEHERDPAMTDATTEHRRLTSAEATELDKAAVNPNDIDVEFDDADNDNEVPPISRSG